MFAAIDSLDRPDPVGNKLLRGPGHQVDEHMTTHHHDCARGEYQRQRQAAATAEASMATCHAVQVGITPNGCPPTRPKMAHLTS